MADVLEQLRASLGDRYEVEREVGEGGMATVFLATDRRHGRRVAIKTLKAELAASIGADRFLREIRLAANLQHPHVLALYDSGEANGILYYVMPFIEGESLRNRLDREQQLPLYDAVRIAREAAEALAYAHEQGVVHRDIKPENILLQNGHALVADFGIARALDAAGEKLTQTGMAVGTPHYMSPEQALGSDHTDGRSDVYSLGCVLYELLAGQPPFDGPNTRAIIARHAMEQVPSIQVVRQSVPDELEEAVLHALEKTPADRFQKMSEFAELLADLEPTLATRRTTAPRIPATRRSSSTRVAVKRTTPVAVLGEKWGTGVRLWSLSAALLAALAVGAFAVWRSLTAGGAAASPGGSGLDPRRIAVMYFQQRGGSDSLEYLADGLTEALIRELSQVKTLQVISGNGVAPFKESNAAPDSIGRALRVGTILQGAVAQSGNRLRVNVSLIDAGTGAELGSTTIEHPREEIFAMQDDLAKEVATFLRRQLGEEIQLRETRAGTSSPAAWDALQQAERVRKEADALLVAGDTAGAGRYLARADSMLGAAEGIDPRWNTPATQRAWLAYRQSELAGYDEALNDKWTRIGLEHADRALTLQPGDPEALEIRGTLRYWRWLMSLEPDQARAAQLLKDAEADLRGAVTANPTAAWAWTVLSFLLSSEGQTAEGKLAAQRSYEADPYLKSARQTVWRLFQASLDLEDAKEARHWCEQGRERFPDYYRFAECRIWLYSLKGVPPEPASAWAEYERFVEQTPPALKPYHRLYGRMLVALALARAGLPDSARAVAEGARGDVSVDPTKDLTYYEALLRIVLGEQEEAIRLLSTYVAANPQMRASIAKDQTWWFRDIRSTPRFKSLFGTAD
ncbi:MAG: protein kinase domain-containing protein [Gemmatimonadales bacterium]